MKKLLLMLVKNLSQSIEGVVDVCEFEAGNVVFATG